MKPRQPDRSNKRGLSGRIGGTFLGATPLRAGAEGVALVAVLCLGIFLSSDGRFATDAALVQVLVVGPLAAMVIAGRMRLGVGGWRANLPREGALGVVLVAVVTAVGVLAAVGADSGPRVGVVDIFPAAFGFFLWNLHSRSSVRWRTCGRGGSGSGGAA